MRLGTTAIFIAALLCAAFAALLVRAALVSTGEARIEANIAMRSIIVASRDLKAGEKLTADMVRETGWPVDMVPKGAFIAREALFKGGEERIVSVAISENEPILAARFLGNADNSLAGRLNEGMRGVTIRVNDASGVGGFVQPEDRVDVLLTQTERQSESSNAAPRAYTKTLVKNVRVLAADQQVQRKQQTQPPKTVTLEVSEEDAKKLTLAGAIGQLSLTLNKGESSQEAGRIVDLRDIAALPDEPAPRTSLIDGTPVVSIFRSVEKKEYRVPQQ
jgi:pilus assembly protein CpaB